MKKQRRLWAEWVSVLYNYITLFLAIELPVTDARIARAEVCFNYPFSCRLIHDRRTTQAGSFQPDT